MSKLQKLIDITLYNLFCMNHLRKYLTQYLIQCNKLEVAAEHIRQSIATNSYFQTVTVFERFDKFRKGYLEPADFSEFMLENQVYPTEGELYLIFKDFDKFRRGIVKLQDFQAELLPSENRKLKKQVLERHPYPVQLRLQIDLQFLLGRYFQDKIKSIGVLNELRDRIKLLKPNAVVQGFSLMDERKGGFLSKIQQLDNFLRNNGKAIKNQQLLRIFRVLNFDSNSQITRGMFLQHLDPFSLGTYQGYKRKMVEKQTIQRRYIANKYQIEHLRTNNILEREKLSYQIGQLRDSNRRLREIMDEQDIINYHEQRRWIGY